MNSYAGSRIAWVWIELQPSILRLRASERIDAGSQGGKEDSKNSSGQPSEYDVYRGIGMSQACCLPSGNGWRTLSLCLALTYLSMPHPA